MKTFKSRLAAIVTLLCSLTANAYDFKVDGICYTTTSDTTVCVTYNGSLSGGNVISYNYYGKYTGDIIIPKEIIKDNIIYRVTSIGDHAFHSCSSLTSINIPESVTVIGASAFYDCSSLTAITIPESVTRLGNTAFYGCSSLIFINIPENVTSIGTYAFYDCYSLTAVYINSIEAWCKIYFADSNGYYTNGYYTNPLSYAKNLYLNGNLVTELSIPEGVTRIESYAFYNCASLTSVNIPKSVTSIGEYAFKGCSKLYKVVNCSNLSLSAAAGSSSYGYVAHYAKQIINGSELTTIGDFQFRTSNGVHYLENYIGKEQNLVLPNDYNGANYQIGTCAFYGYNNLYSVTIGSGVLSVGSYAFSIVPKKTIWLTNTPPTGYANAKGDINYVANDQYTSLSNVKVYPYLSSMFEVDGVKYVPVSPAERTCDAIDCAYNSSASTIDVNETVSFRGIAMTMKEVMPYTFYGNNHIKEVSVSHKGNIGDYAFYNCDSIQSVDLANEGDVGSQTFYDCDGIQSVELSNEGNIGNKAFYGCNGMLTAIISNQGDIESQAFYDCDSLRMLNISNIGNVGEEAFRGCDALETVIVANSPKETDSTVSTPQPITFADWTSTNHSNSSTSSETYTFTATEGATLSFDWWVSSESGYDKLIVMLDGTTILEKSGSQSGTYNNAISQGEHTLVVRYTKDSSDSSGSDQASVSNIVVSAGSNTTVLDGAVCNNAFYDCVSLKSVTLGDKVTSLGNDAFRGCTSLQEIVIPNSVKWVGTYCFYGCTVMKSAVIGDGLTNVKEYTFANCGLEKIIIGDNITSIGNYAFKECRGMKSAVLGNGLTKVNGTMFNGCIGLENVEIGNKVTELEANAFSGCSSLPTITIPQAVTKIGDNVFVGCSKLADVIIADRTEPLALGSNGSSPLFVDCPLDSVYIGGKITYNTTSSKGYSPFYRNTSLRTVVITDREEQIYDNEFYGCTNLQNVTIGNGVKSIGNYAFSGCSSLEGFSFGSSMESIGAEAFSDCTALTSLTSYAAVPPTCGTQALDDINKWECVLGVPLGNADAYYAADQWKEFFFIEDVVEVDHYVLTYVVDGEVVHTEVLKHKDPVTMLAEPTKVGYEFSGWDKTITTMPAEDVIISGTFTRLPVENLVILDTEENFLIDEEMECETVTYTRHFNDTQWQALYVPFEIPVTEEFLADFEVADLNNVHQYDRDDDGVTDETVIEAFKMTSGVLEANYPYLIRTKEAGEKSIIVTDAALYATEENSIDCSSVRDKFTFTGTYSCLSSAELPQGEGYYTLIEGEWKPVTEDVSLGAFRFYLKVDSRSDAPAAEARSIRMRIIGENGEDDSTGIDNLESTGNDGKTTVIYDLQGRKVLNTETVQEGVYIINGKKVVIK